MKKVISRSLENKTHLAVNAHDNSITLFVVHPEFLDF